MSKKTIGGLLKLARQEFGAAGLVRDRISRTDGLPFVWVKGSIPEDWDKLVAFQKTVVRKGYDGLAHIILGESNAE